MANAHVRRCGLALVLALAGSLACAQFAAPAVPTLALRSSATDNSTYTKNPPSPIGGGLLSLPASGVPGGLEPLFQLSDSDIKFRFSTLMQLLRDNRHEGWVLAAYPDPKTSEPLIGAGFTLSLPMREHAQRDPLNPNSFLEPSSEQLWQAAGFNVDQLHVILDQYQSNLETWGTRKYRKKIRKHDLTQQVTEDEATSLLRVSAVQAVVNARAYCRNFSQLTASQQMALTQLVYQMGVNLEEFTQFLNLINQGSGLQNASLSVSQDAAPLPLDSQEYWRDVQASLIHSQWARKYSARAVSVIAMFDPAYAESPSAAERRVKAILRPAKHHKNKKSRPHAAKA